MLLEDLNFVNGAVSNQEFIPQHSHYKITDGKVYAFNGSLTMCSPINCDLDCVPKADALFKALARSSDAVAMHMTEAGRLSVKAGKFKALINCLPVDQFATPEPDGEYVEGFDGEKLVEAMKILEPFISKDASRAWSCGLLLRQGNLYATNNVILVKYKTDAGTGDLEANIPVDLVKEIVRLGQTPISLQATKNTLTFHYPDGKWVRSNLRGYVWPEVDTMIVPRETQPVPEGFFEAINGVLPFADKTFSKLTFGEGKVLSGDPLEADAEFEVSGFDHTGMYNVHMLKMIESICDEIDFSAYPNPCFFKSGDRITGVIIGLK